jgi:hypothetical protein
VSSGSLQPIDPSRLICRHHWYLVSEDLGDLVWATWRSGVGALSPEYFNAIHRVITVCCLGLRSATPSRESRDAPLNQGSAPACRNSATRGSPPSSCRSRPGDYSAESVEEFVTRQIDLFAG